MTVGAPISSCKFSSAEKALTVVAPCIQSLSGSNGNFSGTSCTRKPKMVYKGFVSFRSASIVIQFVHCPEREIRALPM